jgi:hypothetical protein
MTVRFLMNDRKEKAMRAFNGGGYKRGGRVTEIAIVMGMPKGMKKHGMSCGKSPIKKALGGPMAPENSEAMQNVIKANQMLKDGFGLKKGGPARPGHFKNRMCKANGGPVGLTQMANRDLEAGKSLMGLKKGGDVRMAAGGAGKIRKHVMSKSGKPLPTSLARRRCRDM